MVDVSGVGSARPAGAIRDRLVRNATNAATSGAPFQERTPSMIVTTAGLLAAEPPAFDHAKVATLRAALAKGDLVIEHARIADILLGTAE